MVELPKNMLDKALKQPSPNNSWISGISLPLLLQSEKYRMKFAITHSTTNIMAQKMLGMPDTTFYRKLKNYGLEKYRQESLG